MPVREALRSFESQELGISARRRVVQATGFSMDEIKEVADMLTTLEVLALDHASPDLTKVILDQAEGTTKAGDRAGEVQAKERQRRLPELDPDALRSTHASESD